MTFNFIWSKPSSFFVLFSNFGIKQVSSHSSNQVKNWDKKSNNYNCYISSIFFSTITREREIEGRLKTTLLCLFFLFLLLFLFFVFVHLCVYESTWGHLFDISCTRFAWNRIAFSPPPPPLPPEVFHQKSSIHLL